MKVVVCVKHVPDGRTRLDPASHRLDRSGSGDINKMDRYAVEEALRLKDVSGCEVVAVSVGPDQAVESLRTALALGSDRAIHVTDTVLAGSDILATSAVLAALLRREQPDLVLFGQQTSDGGGAMMWAAVAERLHWPTVSQVTALDLEEQSVRVTRQTEYGDDIVEAPLPAAIAVTDAINEPRYASLKGTMAAKRKPLERLSAADLGLDAAGLGETGSKTEVLRVGPPPDRAAARRVEDESGAAEMIVEFLVENQLV
jgi:electron transfer flavoprotein beta subunit